MDTSSIYPRKLRTHDVEDSNELVMIGQQRITQLLVLEWGQHNFETLFNLIVLSCDT